MIAHTIITDTIACVKTLSDERIDAEHLAAWRALFEAHAAVVRRLERELEAEGVLPLGWYEVLRALEAEPERRLRMHELAEVVGLSRSGLTRLVDRLEGAGYLSREDCSSDRRGCFAVLREKGQEALRRTRPVYERGVIGHFGRHLDDGEVRVLAAALERVRDAARGG